MEAGNSALTWTPTRLRRAAPSCGSLRGGVASLSARSSGLDLYAHGARWRTTGETAGTNYARASAILRAAVPLVYPTWRLGLGGGWGNDLGRRAPPTQLVLGGGSHAPWVSRLGHNGIVVRAGPVGSGPDLRHRHGERFRRRRLGRPPNGFRGGTICSTESEWVEVSSMACSAWTCPTGSRVPTNSSGSTCIWTRCSEGFLHPTPKVSHSDTASEHPDP